MFFSKESESLLFFKEKLNCFFPGVKSAPLTSIYTKELNHANTLWKNLYNSQ